MSQLGTGREGGPRKIHPRMYGLPAPQWILREGARKGTGAVEPRQLAKLLDDVFGPWNWSTDVVHPPTLDLNEVVDADDGKGGHFKRRMLVASASMKITVRTAEGEFARSGSGAFTVRRTADARREGGLGGVELAMKGAVTNAFKRAAAQIGRRFGADCAEAEMTLRKMQSAAQDAARRAMKQAQGLAERTEARLKEGGLAGAEATQALDRAWDAVAWAGAVDPWTTRDWEAQWRERLRVLEDETPKALEAQ